MLIRKFGYVPVLAIAMAMMMGRGLIVARLLTIPEFSAYSLGLLISGTYCMLVCLGLQPLLQREMPVNIVLGCERRAVVSLAQCGIVATISVFISISIVAGFMGSGRASTAYIGLFHGLSQQLFTIVTVESRSRCELRRFAWQNFIRGFTFVGIASIVSAAGGSANLVLLSEAVATIICVAPIMVSIVRRINISAYGVLVIAFRRITKVDWKAAIVLLLISLIVFLLFNADRWIASRYMSVEDFGLYSFAVIVLVMGGALQALINAFVFPELAKKYALEGGGAIYKSSAILSIALLIGGLLLSIPAYYVLIQIIRDFFPRYVAISDLLIVFLVAGSVRLSDFWSSYLIITRRERSVLMVNVTTTVVGLVAWGWFVQPWAGGVKLSDIASLAITLSVLNVSLLMGVALYTSAIYDKTSR